MHAIETQRETIFLQNQKDGYKSLNSGKFVGIVMTIIRGETKNH